MPLTWPAPARSSTRAAAQAWCPSTRPAKVSPLASPRWFVAPASFPALRYSWLLTGLQLGYCCWRGAHLLAKYHGADGRAQHPESRWAMLHFRQARQRIRQRRGCRCRCPQAGERCPARQRHHTSRNPGDGVEPGRPYFRCGPSQCLWLSRGTPHADLLFRYNPSQQGAANRQHQTRVPVCRPRRTPDRICRMPWHGNSSWRLEGSSGGLRGLLQGPPDHGPAYYRVREGQRRAPRGQCRRGWAHQGRACCREGIHTTSRKLQNAKPKY